MQISRSIKIDAPIEKVYNSVSDFKVWPKWSPWLITEPDCKVFYADDGKSYTWDGKFVGSGKMRITDQVESQSLNYQLEFLKPWKSTADVAMNLKADGDSTNVTWSMNSGVPFFMFFIKRMMENLIGMDYERGLSMLKDLLETGDVPVKLKFGEANMGPISVVARRTKCRIEDMPESMTSDIEKLKAWHESSDACFAGKMLSVYHKWDLTKGMVNYSTGFPMDKIPDDLPDGFVSFEIPEVKAFTSQLTGPYRHLGNAWSACISRERKAFKKNRKAAPFEIYENDPGTVDENELVTTIYFPIK